MVPGTWYIFFRALRSSDTPLAGRALRNLNNMRLAGCGGRARVKPGLSMMNPDGSDYERYRQLLEGSFPLADADRSSILECQLPLFIPLVRQVFTSTNTTRLVYTIYEILISRKKSVEKKVSKKKCKVQSAKKKYKVQSAKCDVLFDHCTLHFALCTFFFALYSFSISDAPSSTLTCRLLMNSSRTRTRSVPGRRVSKMP